MAFGYAFAPTEAQGQQAKSGSVSPPFGTQGSIKTLSYSLPKVTGAAGLSPLVSDQRQGSGISSAVLESVLRTVLGPDHAATILAPSPAPQGPGNPASAGGNDDGMAAIIKALGGDGNGNGLPTGGTPAPSIHPGGTPDTGAPNVGADAIAFPGDPGPGGRSDVPAPTPDSDRSLPGLAGDQTGPTSGPLPVPDFGGGADNWRTRKQGDWATQGI